jgi:hypothetical protein
MASTAGEQRRQVARPQRERPSGLVGEGQRAFPRLPVEPAVADEVQHVPGAVVPYGVAQRPPGLPRHPAQLEPSGLFTQRGQRTPQQILLGINGESATVAGAGRHGEHSQRRRYRQRRDRARRREVADQRRDDAEVVVVIRVEQELPRQPGQFGEFDPQHQPQPPAVGNGVACGGEQTAHVLGEQRPVQQAAELADRQLMGGRRTPYGRRRNDHRFGNTGREGVEVHAA